MKTVLSIIAAAVISYILGSVSFAVIFANIFAKKDVRKYGSGNAGMTNVMRVVGVVPGILTFVFDAAKGFLTAYLAKYVFFEYAYRVTGNEIFNPVYGALFCGLLCVIGHAFPVFFGFRGGKGVATCLGIFLVCNTYGILSALAVFVIVFLICRIISVGSLCGVVALVVSYIPFYSNKAEFLPQIILCGFIAVLVFVMHRDNIKRIIAGEEKRFVIKKGE